VCVCVCGWVSDCASLVALLPECVLFVCVWMSDCVSLVALLLECVLCV